MLKYGNGRKHHVICLVVSIYWFRSGTTDINSTSSTRKLKQMTEKLHLLGESKRKLTQKVNATEAGPNSIRETIVPLANSFSLEMDAVTLNEYIIMITMYKVI